MYWILIRFILDFYWMNKLKVYLMVELIVNVVDFIVGLVVYGVIFVDEFVFFGIWVDVYGSVFVVVGVVGMICICDFIYLELKIEGKKMYEVIIIKVDCLKLLKIS